MDPQKRREEDFVCLHIQIERVLAEKSRGRGTADERARVRRTARSRSGEKRKITRRLRLKKEKKGGRSARKEKQETAEFLWGLVRGRLLQRLGFGCYCPLMPRRLLCLAVLPHLRRRLLRGLRNRCSEAPLPSRSKQRVHFGARCSKEARHQKAPASSSSKLYARSGTCNSFMLLWMLKYKRERMVQSAQAALN